MIGKRGDLVDVPLKKNKVRGNQGEAVGRENHQGERKCRSLRTSSLIKLSLYNMHGE